MRVKTQHDDPICTGLDKVEHLNTDMSLVALKLSGDGKGRVWSDLSSAAVQTLANVSNSLYSDHRSLLQK